ncbi:MAG: hypothetical protein GX089_17450 [Fibrobacter sp.]|jgi:thiamine biosynthesis lipoprotein ApbE|nr:hypothetical protein [Fibrobacter sp.]
MSTYINPVRGNPVEPGHIGVTVVASDTITADALSTTLF